MSYDNEPRPDVEMHPHVRMLIENQQKRTQDRNTFRDREKEYAERQEEIMKAKPFHIVEFYCTHCHEDFADLAHKQIELDWSNSLQNIAFYKGKHDCGTWAIRYITDKLADPYWTESMQVAQDRGKHFADLLQPFETGYQTLYGRKNA